jgi:CubicO group peptidase (beta-lactamase class C family)
MADDIGGLVERQHRRKGAAAQICVVRRDQVALDRSWGCSADSLFLLYSASKPFVALLVHLLAESGRLSLDDPVAAHWPEFALHGKSSITIRHVLQHRAGVPLASGVVAMVAHMHDWDRSVRDVERAKPRWPAGQVPAYHVISYGFILGEIVQRVTGRPLREVLSSEFLAPLGLHDIHLGLPDDALKRAIPVIASHPSEFINQLLFNRTRIRQAVIPAASLSSNAMQLARLYRMLLRGGEVDGVRVLQPATIAEARRPSSEGAIDALIKRPVGWSQAFQLGGPGDDPRDMRQLMGSGSTRETFGHGGNASCIAWADPKRELVFVYLSNIQSGIESGIVHLREVSDAVLATFG